MAEEVLVSLSLIIAISAIATIVARVIKQPAIIAYLIAGILSGPLFFNIMGGDASAIIQIFAHIGVAFLLFIVGLSLDLRVFKEVGKVSFIVGFIQILVTGILGFLLAIGLGFSNMVALYMAVVLSFSSTVVVVKILSDKKELDTLHGRISLGILIVQDFVAALALMSVPLLNNQGDPMQLIVKFGIAISLITFVLIFSHLVLNRFMSYLARSQETLFLFGIAWALILATIFLRLGFSLEIGALVAGISLASSKYTLELGGKMKPLRDFFVVLFFVFFGSQLAGTISFELIKKALLFSLFVIVFKTLIVMIMLRIYGYKKKTNFLTGISLAQISEFSLILTLLGFNLGHLSQEIMSLSILIALITIGISSYELYYSGFLFRKLSFFLTVFEGKKQRNEATKKEQFDVVLFGYHRVGYKILNALKDLKVNFVVVDYNPKVISSLSKEGVKCIYGDAGDKEFLRELNIEKVKIIISTIPDTASNLTIKERLDELRSKAVFIATTEQSSSALDLYDSGIDYVILPHSLGGEYAAHMIRNFQIDKRKYKEAGIKHLKELIRGKNNSRFFEN